MPVPAFSIVAPINVAGSGGATALTAATVASPDGSAVADERVVANGANLVKELCVLIPPLLRFQAACGRGESETTTAELTAKKTPGLRIGQTEGAHSSNQEEPESLRSFYGRHSSRVLLGDVQNQLKRYFSVSGESADALFNLRVIFDCLKSREAPLVLEEVAKQVSEKAIAKQDSRLLDLVMKQQIGTTVAPEYRPPVQVPPYLGPEKPKDNEVASPNFERPVSSSQAGDSLTTFPEIKDPTLKKMPGPTIPQASKDDALVHLDLPGSPKQKENPADQTNSENTKAGRTEGDSDLGHLPEVYQDAGKRIRDFVESLEPGSKLLIVGHKNNDLDALAAQVEAGRMAKASSGDGVQVAVVVATESLDSRLQSICQRDNILGKLGIQVIPREEMQGMVDKNTAVLIVDTSNLANTDLVGTSPQKILAIDHHQSPQSEAGLATRYHIPALALGFSQYMAANPKKVEGVDLAAGFLGILTDTNVDLLFARNPKILAKMLDPESKAEVILEGGGEPRRKIPGHNIDFSQPMTFELLSQLHLGLKTGQIDPALIEPDFYQMLKSDPVLMYLAQPKNSGLRSTLDSLLGGIREKGGLAVSVIQDYERKSIDALGEMQNSSSKRKIHDFDEYDLTQGPAASGSMLGLMSISNFDSPGHIIVARAQLDDGRYQASVLLSGRNSSAIAQKLQKLFAGHGIDSGFAPPIFGEDLAIIRFGAKFSTLQLPLFHQIVGTVSGN